MHRDYQDRNGSNSNKPDKKDKFIRTNYKIRNMYSRVIEDGKPPRIMATEDAIQYAQSLGLDLIEIGYDKSNNCSNCKVADYSKYMYEQKKREKEAKKQARANKADIKSVQMTLTTDVADKARMIEHAKQFLADGDKVKISLRFRNRHETENVEMAKDLMKEVLNAFEGIATLDSNPSMSGKEMSCIIRRV